MSRKGHGPSVLPLWGPKDGGETGGSPHEEAPVVGDVVETTVCGQPMKVEKIWGHWADRRSRNPDLIVPLRAKEI